ncbi:hypothetical protein HYW55_04710 [Candidatus Gottesmanbacteria bacterium]|nr:hypothetical protein [Candidatus Gottesmanbacteria bacterium]
MKFIQNILFEKFFQFSLISSVGSVLSGLISFGVYLLLIRYLTFEEYGIYTSLFAIVGLITFFSHSFSLYFTTIGSLQKNGKISSREVLKILKVFSAKVLISVILLSVLLLILKEEILLYFPQFPFQYFWFILLLTFIALLHPMIDGLLQGLQQFVQLTALSLFITLIKALGISLAVIYSLSLPYILLAVIFSIFILYVLSYLLYRRYPTIRIRKNTSKNVSLYLPGIWTYAGITLFLGSFFNTDILILSHVQNPLLVGQYAVQMNIAKIVLFGNSILLPIVYSLSSHFAIRKDSGHKIPFQAIFFSLFFSGLMIILIRFFPQFILPLFSKKNFSPAENILIIMILTTTFFSLSTILLHYLLSYRQTIFLIPLIFLNILQIALLTLYHNSFFEIAISMFIIQLILLFIALTFFLTYIYKQSWKKNLSTEFSKQ